MSHIAAFFVVAFLGISANAQYGLVCKGQDKVSGQSYEAQISFAAAKIHLDGKELVTLPHNYSSRMPAQLDREVINYRHRAIEQGYGLFLTTGGKDYTTTAELYVYNSQGIVKSIDLDECN